MIVQGMLRWHLQMPVQHVQVCEGHACGGMLYGFQRFRPSCSAAHTGLAQQP